ncbi:hypothetical protein Prudu_007523, partial [Prunus dulcis]
SRRPVRRFDVIERERRKRCDRRQEKGLGFLSPLLAPLKWQQAREFGSDGSSHSLNSVPILPQPHQFLAFFFVWNGLYPVETKILGPIFSLCKSVWDEKLLLYNVLLVYLLLPEQSSTSEQLCTGTNIIYLSYRLGNLGDKIEGLLSENILSKVSVDCYFNLAFQHLRQDGQVN